MNDISENKSEKNICIGLLAHVDAGKTTLSESMLYISGAIREYGRVDHKDAFLDTYELERERGITIFSKQAVFTTKDMKITLLDTPGHADFSAETERTLGVLDYAVLVINGTDGVQGHTVTLWKLLKRYAIPTFLFVNKMDQSGTDRRKIMEQLKVRLGSECLDFTPDTDEEKFFEQLALCDEQLLEKYLEGGLASREDIVRLVAKRAVFPCYFGSALKLNGVKELLEGLGKYTKEPSYPAEFGAKVYKISRDGQGNRLSYLKVTGGSLKVKDIIEIKNRNVPDEVLREKADQIRIYSGAKYEMATEARAGTVCAVTGLTGTYPGQGLGIEAASFTPVLMPVLTYRIILPQGTDAHVMLRNLRQLEEEDPQLHIVWNERLGEIHVKLMGEVQIDILKHLIWERFGTAVQFDAGSIVYKETIKEPAEGVGHYEPLRHYAEVHLLLEPLEQGSGLVFDSDVSTDELDGNWQHLILTHLEEKEHVGVLTGSPITDMKITLIAGRAHLKHTEGGDFRQATYRAVRQGLKKAESILLEPYYEFRIEVPPECVGRAMSDIQRMNGTFGTPVSEGGISVIKGNAPVAAMRDYQTEVIAYTKGQGRLFCVPFGYRPCKDAEAVIEKTGYNSENDLDNPTGSVFCAHGAGFLVSWDKVEDYMHVESGWKKEKEGAFEGPDYSSGKNIQDAVGEVSAHDEKELEEIFTRTYGPIRRKHLPERRKINAYTSETVHKPPENKKKEPKEEYLLVDGYNIIFAWDDLKELAEVNIMSARDKLMDILCNYQGFRKMTLILVFDAYKVEGNPGAASKYNNIHIVYTKEAETADQYIEKTVHRIGRKYHVTVATSDALEQVIILGQGGHRISAEGLRKEIEQAQKELREEHLQKTQGGKRYLFDGLDGETAGYVEEMRWGKTTE